MAGCRCAAGERSGMGEERGWHFPLPPGVRAAPHPYSDLLCMAEAASVINKSSQNCKYDPAGCKNTDPTVLHGSGRQPGSGAAALGSISLHNARGSQTGGTGSRSSPRRQRPRGAGPSSPGSCKNSLSVTISAPRGSRGAEGQALVTGDEATPGAGSETEGRLL